MLRWVARWPQFGWLSSSSNKKAAVADVTANAQMYGITIDPLQDMEEIEEQQVVEVDVHQLVQSEVDEYVKDCGLLCSDGPKLIDFLSRYPKETIHTWWKHNRDSYPILYQVARAALSITASSGNLERDFCDIRHLITHSRTSLSPWTVEMLLLCHSLQRDPKHQLAVDDVEKMTKDEVKKAMPSRVTNKDLAAALEGLDMGEKEIEDLGSLPDDIERLAPWSTVAELAQMWENWDENELEEVQW